MSCHVDIELRYGRQGEADPEPAEVAQAVVRLLRPKVHHVHTYSVSNDPSLDAPTIDASDSVVLITLQVDESRKGSFPRMDWIVNELIAGLMRDSPHDRPDLALDPESVSVRLVKR